jgi:hypothetical protein
MKRFVAVGIGAGLLGVGLIAIRKGTQSPSPPTLSSGEVPPIPTPVANADAVAAFRAAYVAVTGQEPVSESSYVLPAAQSALETGQWKKMFNFNAGNITHVPNDGHPFMHEYSGSLPFRAYPDLVSGVVDMMHLLARRGLLSFADAGDVVGYNNRLAQVGYVGGCKPPCVPYPSLRQMASELTGIA